MKRSPFARVGNADVVVPKAAFDAAIVAAADPALQPPFKAAAAEAGGRSPLM